VESLHLKKKIFSSWQTLQNIFKNPSKYALKCSKMQLRRYRISTFSEGACPRTPLEEWCLYIDLSLATPLICVYAVLVI